MNIQSYVPFPRNRKTCGQGCSRRKCQSTATAMTVSGFGLRFGGRESGAQCRDGWNKAGAQRPPPNPAGGSIPTIWLFRCKLVTSARFEQRNRRGCGEKGPAVSREAEQRARWSRRGECCSTRLFLVELGLPLFQCRDDFVEFRRFAEKHLLHLGVIFTQCFEAVLWWRNA